MFTNQAFKAWNLPPQLQSGLDSLGWEFATQVQKDTIPLARKGLDIIGQARTGSGKTAAFGIPILESMASGLPMVLSNTKIFREITENKYLYFDEILWNRNYKR